MQRNLSRICLVALGVVMLGRAVNATISIDCSFGTCEDPLLLRFTSPSCDDRAMAYNAFNRNVSENTCITSPGFSIKYTCGNGMYQTTAWTNTDCTGDPYQVVTQLTHVCLRRKLPSMPDVFEMIICGRDDLEAPVTLASNFPNPSDPLAEPSESVCPDGICRPGYASETWYNESRTCTGPSYTKSSNGELGVCTRTNNSYISTMTTCDENALRTVSHAGSCNDLAYHILDVFRRPGNCTATSPSRQNSRSEIYCPTAPAAPTGQAASLCLPLILAFVLLAITSSISL